jgi:hypothetical protein
MTSIFLLREKKSFFMQKTGSTSLLFKLNVAHKCMERNDHQLGSLHTEPIFSTALEALLSHNNIGPWFENDFQLPSMR